VVQGDLFDCHHASGVRDGRTVRQHDQRSCHSEGEVASVEKFGFGFGPVVQNLRESPNQSLNRIETDVGFAGNSNSNSIRVEYKDSFRGEQNSDNLKKQRQRSNDQLGHNHKSDCMHKHTMEIRREITQGWRIELVKQKRMTTRKTTKRKKKRKEQEKEKEKEEELEGIIQKSIGQD